MSWVLRLSSFINNFQNTFFFLLPLLVLDLRPIIALVRGVVAVVLVVVAVSFAAGDHVIEHDASDAGVHLAELLEGLPEGAGAGFAGADDQEHAIQ
ncbi:MAG: hypothetical protein Q8N39_01635 [Pelolinea sp.]|nr:hypothetical protein [Pelolinea sp.]